jgi:hypothetical protein
LLLLLLGGVPEASMMYRFLGIGGARRRHKLWRHHQVLSILWLLQPKEKVTAVRISIGRILAALVAPALVALLAFRLLIWPKLQQAGARTPTADAAMLLRAVADWRSSHGPSACPSLAELRGASLIDPGEPLPTDPWHSQYIIECEGESVAVRAPGPDRTANTLDDLLIH